MTRLHAAAPASSSSRSACMSSRSISRPSAPCTRHWRAERRSPSTRTWRLTLAAAQRLLSEVAPLLENIEEPVPSLQRDGGARPRYFDVNSPRTARILRRCSHIPHVDAVPTLDACGGISGVRRAGAVARRCRATRVGALARRERHRLGGHRAPRVCRPLSFARPAQSLMDLISDDLVLGEPWDVRQGAVRAPAAPGLGVALDRGALLACHALYRERGEVPAFPPALRRGAAAP